MPSGVQTALKLPNNDGIDLDRCRNVRISDCHIVSGDDCICLKACRETEGFGPCENVTVTGCTLTSTSSALIVGAECRAPIRNVVFDACVIQSSHRGLAIHLPDYFRHALEAHAEMVQSLQTQISADAR